MFELQKKMAMSLSAADISKLKKLIQSLPEVSDADNVKELLLLLASTFADAKKTLVSKEVSESLQTANQELTTANKELTDELAKVKSDWQQALDDLKAFGEEKEKEKTEASTALQSLQTQLSQKEAEFANLKSQPLRLGQNQVVIEPNEQLMHMARKYRPMMKADGHLKTDDPTEFFNYAASQWLKIFYGHHEK